VGYGGSAADTVASQAIHPTKPADFTRLNPAERSRWNAEFKRCYEAGLEAADQATRQALARLPADLRDEIMQAGRLAHPTIVSHLGSWSACLAQKGWQYDHPLQVLGDVHAQRERLGANPAAAELEQVRQNERALAVADWDCAEQHVRPAVVQLLNDLEARAAAAGEPASPFQE